MLNCTFSKRESHHFFERLRHKIFMMTFRWTDWLDEVTARYLLRYPDDHETKFDHRCKDLGTAFVSVDVTLLTKLLWGHFKVMQMVTWRLTQSGCPQRDRSTTLFESFKKMQYCRLKHQPQVLVETPSENTHVWEQTVQNDSSDHIISLFFHLTRDLCFCIEFCIINF